MQCEKFESRLSELLDQRRAPQSDSALLAHSHGCPRCRHLLGQTELLLEGLSRREIPPLSAGFADRVLAALDRQSVAQPAARPSVAANLLPWAAAALVLIALVPLWRFATGPTPEPRPALTISFAEGSADWLMFQESPEVYLQMFRYTGHAMATLPDVVRRATVTPTAPDDGLMATGFHPLANSVYAAFGALLNTLPGKALTAS